MGTRNEAYNVGGSKVAGFPLIGPLDLIGTWFGEDHIANMLRRDWTTTSNSDNYFPLDSVHNWEDIHIQFKNQQTCTFNNHN